MMAGAWRGEEGAASFSGFRARAIVIGPVWLSCSLAVSGLGLSETSECWQNLADFQ